jgi:hypothetical protein
MVSPDSRDIACPLAGRNSTHRPVQISGTGSIIPLYKKYTPDKYPTYDNFDAIEVSKTAEIPCDYDGLIGVPDTFLDKYNPEQFEIIGIPFGNLGKEIGVTKIIVVGRTSL